MKKGLFIVLMVFSLAGWAQIGLATRAFRELEAGNLTEAKAKIDEALKDPLTQKHKRAWYYRGRIYEEAYHSNKNPIWAAWSIEGYAKAIELGMDPQTDVLERMHKMGEYTREDGVAFFKKKDFEKAEEFFLASIQVAKAEDRNDSLNYLNIAVTNVKMQNYDRALTYLDTCMNLGFQVGNVAKYTLKIYRAKGDQKMIDKKIAEYRKQYPESDELLMVDINNHLQQNRPSQAVASASTSIKKYPKNASLLVVRGDLHLKLGNPAEAERDYLKATTVDPMYFDGYMSLGELFIKSDVKKAIPHYEKAYEINPIKDDIGTKLLNAYKAAQEYNKYNLLKPKVKS